MPDHHIIVIQLNRKHQTNTLFEQIKNILEILMGYNAVFFLLIYKICNIHFFWCINVVIKTRGNMLRIIIDLPSLYKRS